MKKFVEKAFIGSGKLYLNGRRVGNCPAVKLVYATESKNLPNNQGGGGNIASLERISDVSLEASITNMTAENVAMALQSTINYVAMTVVTDEPVKAYVNGIASPTYMIDTTQPVTVKSATDQPIAASNYEVSAAGVVLKDGFVHTDGALIKISYTIHQSAVLQAALAFGAEFAVLMDGINDDNGETHVLKGHRWKPGPTDGFDLIGTEYATFGLKGSLLADTTKPIGKSQFFELHMTDAA